MVLRDGPFFNDTKHAEVTRDAWAVACDHHNIEDEDLRAPTDKEVRSVSNNVADPSSKLANVHLVVVCRSCGFTPLPVCRSISVQSSWYDHLHD